MKMKRDWIPGAMAAGRAALGPVLLLGARARWNGVTLALLVVAALLSDIFDGILARRWRCDTGALRLFDSRADTMFYACAAVALCMLRPQIWTSFRAGFIAVVVAEAVNIGFARMRYGRQASYHSYIAKTWGLVLATAVLWSFAAKSAPHGLWWAAVGLGVLSNVEGVVFSSLLRSWTRDVKHIGAAWQLHREQPAAVTIKRRSRLVRAGMTMLVAGALVTLGA